MGRNGGDGRVRVAQLRMGNVRGVPGRLRGWDVRAHRQDGQGKERRSTPGRGLGPRDFSYLNFILFCVAFECNIFILHIKGIKFR